MRALCVYCGSSPGNDPAFADAAKEVGQYLGTTGRTLVYGGGHVGLMGILADAALAVGGEVIGVIPQALADREVAHLGLTKLHIVKTMHERKALMADLADGFLTLPGGIGTLEEFFETWTWGQLGIHAKPFGLLNVNDFFSPLLAMIDLMVAKRLLRAEHRAMLRVGSETVGLLHDMESVISVNVPKWIDKKAT